MLRAGCIAISIWTGLNLLLALGIVASLAFLGHNAPALALSFQQEEIRALDARALATVNAVAAIGNGSIVSLCALALTLTWRGIARGSRGALAAVAAALGFVQATGFLSDAYLGHMNLAANVASSALLAAGLLLAALGRVAGTGDALEPRVRIAAITSPPIHARDG